MELGFETIGNATLICHDGGPILTTDPWIQGSPYFGSWTLSHHIPPEQLDSVLHSQYVWFSHGHPDHLNGDSLALLRGRQILLPDHVGARIRLDLAEQGFTVRILRDREWTALSPRIRVLCISDYNQDGILLVDINGRLIVNLNDASNRGWAAFVRNIIRKYSTSYLLALHGYGDADMINFFSEDGRRVPLPPRVPLGQTIARQCDYYGARFFVPFSSMHRYQREDSIWASSITASLEDYSNGYSSERSQILPAFVRVDCRTDLVDPIFPAVSPETIYPPEQFGDHWTDELEAEERERVDRYFHKIQKVRETLDFINIRVGGKDHRLSFRPSTPGRRLKGLTLEAPRHSLMTAIDQKIFDDLLIGNFARVTLHGDWGPRRLYPDFTPHIAKYADNGQVFTRADLKCYLATYRRRDSLGYLQHLVESKVLFPLQSRASDAIRGTLGSQSPVFKALKKSFWHLRKNL